MISHKLSDLVISYVKDPITNLSDVISWNSLYTSNDIKIINFENKVLEMYIFNNGIFHYLKLSDLKLINQIESETMNLCEDILNKSNNLIDFLNKLSNYLNIKNPIHESFKKDKVENLVDPKCDIIFNWNPYKNLKKLDNSKYNYELLKQNSLNYYIENNVEFKNLKTSKEHILEIILKEVKILEENNIDIIFENNLFDFDILLNNFNNKNLSQKLKFNNIDGILLNIKLNCQLYPYFPPNISFKIIFENNLNNVISNLSYFEKNNWNPTNSLFSMINGVKELIDKYGEVKNVIDQKYHKLYTTIHNLINNNNIKFKNNEVNNFDLSYIKLSSDDSCDNDSLYWKSGVGYGTKGRTNWDILNFVKDNEVKNNFNKEQMKVLYDEISKYNNCDKFVSLIIDSNILLVISSFLDGINMLEFDKNSDLYSHLIDIIFLIKFWEWEVKPLYEINLLLRNLSNFVNEIDTFKNLGLKENNNLNILEKYNNFFEIIKKNSNDNEVREDLDNKYINSLKDEMFKDCNFSKYEFSDEVKGSNNKDCISKITKELSSYRHSLPLNNESSIFVRYNTNNITMLKSLIIGPKNTPYENGVFIFDILITNNFPNNPPKFKLITTGNGTIRFNPNLYSNGKVCLSILNTWSGNGGEVWNKDTSTLLQILVSIQSLIFVENPFFNEPGYEKNINNESYSKKSNEYNDKVRFNNIKWAMCDILENIPIEFENIIKTHFKLKKNEISNKINEWYSETNMQKSTFNSINNKCLNLINEL